MLAVMADAVGAQSFHPSSIEFDPETYEPLSVHKPKATRAQVSGQIAAWDRAVKQAQAAQ